MVTPSADLSPPPVVFSPRAPPASPLSSRSSPFHYLGLAATEGKGAGRGGRATVRHLRVILCVSVWRARAHVHRCTSHTLTHQSHSCLCVRLSSRRQPLLPCPPVFCDLAVLGAVGGGLASSAHEWLLQRLGAVTAQRGIAAVALGRCVLLPWHLESLTI